MTTVLIAGLFGILGAVVGAVVNGMINRKNEREKWSREQGVKYKELQMEHYAELLAAGFSLTTTLALTEEQVVRVLHESSIVAIIGSDQGINAAAIYREALMHQVMLPAEEAGKQTDIDAAKEAVNAARAQMLEAAQKDWRNL